MRALCISHDSHHCIIVIAVPDPTHCAYTVLHLSLKEEDGAGGLVGV